MPRLSTGKIPPLWAWGFAIGVVATLVAYSLLKRMEDNDAESVFQTEAVERIDRLEGNIARALDNLTAVGAYFDAAGIPDRTQFARLSAGILASNAPIQALEWVPRVPVHDRQRYVESARRAGYPGFDFTERSAKGGMVPAAARSEYFPVYFVEPYHGNEPALGFDLASSPARFAALEQAMATGKMQATGRIDLVQGGAGQYGFLVFRPVYRQGMAGTDDLSGFVLAVFRIGAIVDGGNKGWAKVRLALFDDEAEAGGHLLYPAKLPADRPAALTGGMKLERKIRVAGRSWTVVAMPGRGDFVPERDGSLAVLVLGLLLSALWASFLRQKSNRLELIESAVEERTRDLDHERGFSNAVFDTVGGIGLVIGRAGEIVRFNHAAEVFTGYAFEEVRGRPFFWKRFLLPEQQDGVESVFKHFHDGSLPNRYENYWVDWAGERRLFDWTNTILSDDRGAPQYLVTIGVDITERKQAEEALRESESRFRQLFEHNNASMLLVDPAAGDIIDANASACTFYGWSHGELLKLKVDDINMLPAVEIAAERHRAQLEERNYFVFPHRLADGSVRTVEVHSTPIRLGERDLLFSIVHDITARKEAEAQVRQLLHEQHTMLDNDIVGILKVRDRVILWANRAFEKMLEYGAGEFEGRSTRVIYISQEDYEILGANAYPVIRQGKSYRGETRLRCKDGRVIWGDINGVMLNAEKGESLWVFLDITERKQAEARLHDSEAKFHTMVDWTYDWEYWIAPDFGFTYITPSVERVTGYRPEEFEANPELINAIVHPDDRHQWERHVRTHLPECGCMEVAEVEMRIVRKDGTVCWVSHICRPVSDEGGRYLGRRVAVRDITAAKLAEEEIRHLAYYDPLTHLPNRRLLMDRLGQALVASRRSRQFGALMILDLDHFKSINDTQGHDIGDRMLVEVARRLSATVRQEDTVSRLGGDEYVVMFEGLGEAEEGAAKQAEIVAEKIRETLNRPYVLGGSEAEYATTPSIGLALFLGQDESADALLKQADVALYQAKDAGRNTVRFFNPAMQAAIDSRTALESALRRGLDRHEFKLLYQPQVDSDGRLIGAEALIRWLPPGQAPVMPAEFIPLAEESGLILQLGVWVLNTACAQLRDWTADPRTRDLQLSINVSARQFRQPDFAEEVHRALMVSGVEPRRLKLELTESVLLDNVDDVVCRMRQLDDLGVGIALDDFGTGYSSLSYLKRLPLDQIKIDQSFVREVSRDANDAAIVRAILAMSGSLGLQVIAEGVETAEQRDFLHDNGCIAYQGYLFGKPMPAEEMLAALP